MIDEPVHPQETMAEVARIIDEWRYGPKLSETALSEIRVLALAYLSASAEEKAWEFFQDEGYFGMWCVREVGASRFGDGVHVASQEEARALRAALSAAAIRKG